MPTAAEALAAKTAMPFATGPGGQLAYAPRSAHGAPTVPWTPVTSPVALARGRNTDRRDVEAGLGTLPHADPPAGHRLVPHEAIGGLKVAALSTLALIDLYNKPRHEWNDEDKAMAAEFGAQIAAFDEAHKTAGFTIEEKLERQRVRRGITKEQQDAEGAEILASFPFEGKIANKLWPKALRDLLAKKNGPDQFHAALKAELKQAAVSEMIRSTASDAAPTGTEVHPPLLSNPYMGADPAGAQEYENGYQYAQEQGHMVLSTAGQEQWDRWFMNPRPWVDGFTAGASSVGSQPPVAPKVAMLTALDVLALKEASFPATARFMYEKTAPQRAAGQGGTVAAAGQVLAQPLAKPPASSPAWSAPANMERLLAAGGKKLSALDVLNAKG